ncbi:secreted RxLR effector protein 161-like [Impatiens glandulifera]|uniref:secreted RxLR effector protein 161-like n=1 Tax=Impatiens glandulifera TaxID=253017 RepID=UPI001FB0F90B|nr:secreted RxLR effector protein 161-like [Impatiens glandulifera]
MLSHFGMSTSKTLNTLVAVTDHLFAFASQFEAKKLYMSHVSYASAVGSLIYSMVCTRPDIAYSVSVVSKFMSRLGKEHWQEVKRLFCYRRGTSDVSLIYESNNQCLVTSYSDLNYAADIDGKISMNGYVYTLGDSVVSWKATLQSTVTLSTTEVEYMALTEAAKEVESSLIRLFLLGDTKAR